MEQDRQGEPPPCANNCGFFGSPATNNLCSSCYRDKFSDKPKALLVAKEVSSPSPLEGGVEGSSHLPAAEPSSSSFSLAAAAEVSQKNRCGFCKKKVGLMGFNCRCGDVFCPAHRHAEGHGCPFDYKAAEREAIARANPVMKAKKEAIRNTRIAVAVLLSGHTPDLFPRMTGSS